MARITKSYNLYIKKTINSMQKRGKNLKKKDFGEKGKNKRKKAVSGILVTVLLVILALIIITIIWTVISNLVKRESEVADLTHKMLIEEIEIIDVEIRGSNVILIVRKSGGTVVVKTETQEIPPLEVDLFSVVDISGSMVGCMNVNLSCCDFLGGYHSGNINCYEIQPDKRDDCLSGRCMLTETYWLDRLTPSKEANKNLAEGIIPNSLSRMGVVSYHGEVSNTYSIGLTNNVQELNSLIDSLYIGGYTCICCGINNATNRFLLHSIQNRIKAMIVMSDGMTWVQCPEQGTGNPAQDAIQAACDANQSLSNLTIYSVAFGEGADEDTLKDIAECGGGEFYSTTDGEELINIYKSIEDQIKSTYESAYKFNFLMFIFSNSTDSYTERVSDVPQPLQTKTYLFNLEEKLSGPITSIKMYPVAITSYGREVIGPLVYKWP